MTLHKSTLWLCFPIHSLHIQFIFLARQFMEWQPTYWNFCLFFRLRSHLRNTRFQPRRNDNSQITEMGEHFFCSYWGFYITCNCRKEPHNSLYWI